MTNLLSKLWSALKLLWAKLVWLVSPLVTSVPKRINWDDVRAVVFKMMGVGGMTVAAMHEAVKDQRVQEALWALGFAFAAGMWEGWQRYRHGTHDGQTDANQSQPPAPIAPPPATTNTGA